MRPFFPYFGSKWRLAPRYPAPTHTVVEPFAGSACYSTRMDVPHTVLLDLDPNVAAVWKFLIGATPDDIRALPDLYEEGDSVKYYDIPPGARALIGYWLTKSAAPVLQRNEYASMEGWRHLFWRPAIRERIASQVERIQSWEFVDGGYENAPMVDGATYFIDPPYSDAGKAYKVRFSEYDALARWAKLLPGPTVVCEGGGADWLPFEPLAGKNTFGINGYSREVVWLNGV